MWLLDYPNRESTGQSLKLVRFMFKWISHLEFKLWCRSELLDGPSSNIFEGGTERCNDLHERTTGSKRVLVELRRYYNWNHISSIGSKRERLQCGRTRATGNDVKCDLRWKGLHPNSIIGPLG